MSFVIRDSEGKIHNHHVEHPAAFFDKEDGVLFRIGNRDVVEEKFNQVTSKYIQNGLQDMADDLVFMELPHDQDEIDKVFQITGYIKKLYDRTMLSQSNQDGENE